MRGLSDGHQSRLNVHREQHGDWFSAKVIRAAITGYLLIAGLACAQAQREPRLEIEHVGRMPNVRNPELLYWFISPHEIANQAYVRDLDRVAENGTFSLAFLSQREGADFFDFATMHPIFKDLVQRAHAKGIKIGLQLWTDDKRVPDNETQGIVIEKEIPLDSDGRAELTSESRWVRTTSNFADAPRICLRSELLRVYAFRKTAAGEYQPGSVIDITSSARVEATTPCSVTMRVEATPKVSGYTAYVLTAHYHRYPDMFSPFMTNSFIEAMKAYKDVGFDGAALDEFGYMALHKQPNEQFRGRLYSPRMAAFFHKRTGMDLVRMLFDMRYAPAGDPRPRIRAINMYFDVLRQGPLRVEQSFYAATERIFGVHAFHGIHNTFHNHLDDDEIWATGVNWWDVPRDYGQTDEGTPYTTQLGIGLNHPQPVEYRQHYGSVRSFLDEGMNDARFNVRVDYHALNDEHGWGTDMRDPTMQAQVNAVEDKARLLNQFNAPRPAMNVLYIFGYPALANWYPEETHRNDWDINGNLKAEEKAVAAWNAGYRGPFISSNLIDEGKVTVDEHGDLRYGGMTFHALVFIGPEYSKASTLKLLEAFVNGGGDLLLDGIATRDFDGNDIHDRFAKIATAARATTFNVEAMDRLRVPKLAIEGGALYQDGSVVLTDVDSMATSHPKDVSVAVNGHIFHAQYVGLLAIKSDGSGRIEKLAAGGLRSLECDGKPVVTVSSPSDLVLWRDVGGTYHGFIKGDATITMH